MSPIQICALSPTWKLFLTDLIYKSFDFPLQLVLCDSVSLVLLYKVKDTLFQCLSVGKIIYLIIVIGYSSYTITITLYYCCFYVLIFKMSKLNKKEEKKKKERAFVKSLSTDANINTLYDIHEHKHVATSPTGNVSCYTWQIALYKIFRMLAHITCT